MTVAKTIEELASHLTPDDWHQVSVFVRRDASGSVEIIVGDQIKVVPGAYKADGELWCRNEFDELELLTWKA